jgi:ribosomal protein L32
MVLLAAPAAARAITGPCKVATKGTSPVARACAKGGPQKGASEAKKEMNRLVDKLKAKTGETVECPKCHNGLDDGRYDLLKKDAAKELEVLLARVGEK